MKDETAFSFSYPDRNEFLQTKREVKFSKSPSNNI